MIDAVRTGVLFLTMTPHYVSFLHRKANRGIYETVSRFFLAKPEKRYRI